MTTKDRVRIGLIGLGRFGRLHGRILSTLAGVDLVCAADPAADARTWAQSTLGISTLYESAEELLAHDGLDAVFIVSPEHVHAEQCLAALDRGLHVFMEKPLSTTLDDARTIVARAGETGHLVQIGFVLRFDAQHAMLREGLRTGELGEIGSMHFKRNCSKDWFPAFGDRAHTVHETIIHDIDLAVWFTGSRCTRVYAVQRWLTGHAFPDVLMATLQFASGAVAQLETSWLVPATAPTNVTAGDWIGTIDAEFEINCMEGAARYRLLDSGMSLATANMLVHPETSLWPDVYGSIGGALRTEDEHFIQCVRSGKPSTIASVGDALHGLEIADAIMRSAQSGTEVRP